MATHCPLIRVTEHVISQQSMPWGLTAKHILGPHSKTCLGASQQNMPWHLTAKHALAPHSKTCLGASQQNMPWASQQNMPWGLTAKHALGPHSKTCLGASQLCQYSIYQPALPFYFYGLVNHISLQHNYNMVLMQFDH